MTSHFEVWLRGKHEGAFRHERGARSYAIELARGCDAYCAVYDCQVGRVTEVFDPSGKRLVFPIAQAIAYTAVAQAIAYAGLAHSALRLAREEYMELARKLEELLKDWGNRTC